MNKYVSKSGFILNDVYNELGEKILQRDYEKACYWSAELICSGNMRKLVDWLVEFVCHKYITTNAFFLQFIAHRLEVIKTVGITKWKCEEARKAVCEIVMGLCIERANEVILYKNTMDGGKYVEALYFQRPKNFRELNEGMDLVANNEKYILFVYLYELMIEGDIKSVFKVVSHIVKKAPTIAECETLSIVENVPRFRDDSVWALWQILFVFSKRPQATNKNLQCYLENAFKIFAFDYSRKIKPERLNLLYVCFMICVRQKNVSYYEIDETTIKKASSQITVVYNDILKKKETDKGDKASVKKKVVASATATVSSKKNKEDPKEVEERNEKLRYLFCLTYRNNNNKPFIKKNINPMIAHIKSLEISGDNCAEVDESQQNLMVEKL